MGTVWMDGNPSDADNPETKVAHLRAFIVDDSVRGRGAGRKLLSAAIEWADEQGFAEVKLWTFKGLDAARKLYDEFGFVLQEEMMSAKWGRELMVQHFVRGARRRGGEIY
jgi:GNAT superfamily N-acetyltransferase